MFVCVCVIDRRMLRLSTRRGQTWVHWHIVLHCISPLFILHIQPSARHLVAALLVLYSMYFLYYLYFIKATRKALKDLSQHTLSLPGWLPLSADRHPPRPVQTARLVSVSSRRCCFQALDKYLEFMAVQLYL